MEMKYVEEVISMYDVRISQIGTVPTDLAKFGHWTSLSDLP